MDHTLSLLLSTLHSGPQGQYILRSALCVDLGAMEAEGIHDPYSPEGRTWLHESLPLHAQGEDLVDIDQIFCVHNAAKGC